MNIFPELETKRLKLIEVGQEYSRQLYEIFSSEEVTRFYGMDSFTSVEQASRMIESFGKTYAEKRGIRWGMVSKETGELIGTAGLNNLQSWSKRAEIGFDAHPSYWRGGYTSEAVREVLRYSFEELGLHRVGAVTFPVNIASIRLLQKLGFREEGLMRGYLYQKGQSHDAALFGMVRPDWEADLK